MRQGAQVWVNNGSRSEVQFDDGSRLRLGTGAVATFQTMYSDNNGEFTEIKLNNGLASLTLTNKDSKYQIDTPMTSISAHGPCELRVGIGSDVELCVRRGAVEIEGSQGSAVLSMGQYVDIANQTSAYSVQAAPPEDNWDNFSNNRDYVYDHPSEYIPSNIGIVAGDLNGNGDWREDATYGHVWYPHESDASWRPYHNGHWVWADPYGWTWVGNESWGWAPYHYGSWIHASSGWGWCPGPQRQYWSPAVVDFSVYGGNVAWCPLGPSEIYYPPAFSVGIGGGGLFLSFSIGGAAAYYPGGGNYMVSRPWNNVFVNGGFQGYNSNRFSNIYNNSSYITNNRFVPMYGRASYAITRTSSAGFVGRGGFQNGSAADSAIFQKGRGFAAGRGQAPVFGPASIRPTNSSFSTSRTVASRGPSTAIMQRSVFRTALPTAIARSSTPGGRFSTPSKRAAQVRTASVTNRGKSARTTDATRPNATTSSSRPARTSATNAARAHNANIARARNTNAARVRNSNASTARNSNVARTPKAT